MCIYWDFSGKWSCLQRMIHCLGCGGEYLQACLVLCTVDVEHILFFSSLHRSEDCYCIFLQLSSFPSGKSNLSPSSLHQTHLCPPSAPHILQLEKSKRWFIVLHRQNCLSLASAWKCDFSNCPRAMYKHPKPILLTNPQCWGRSRAHQSRNGRCTDCL